MSGNVDYLNELDAVANSDKISTTKHSSANAEKEAAEKEAAEKEAAEKEAAEKEAAEKEAAEKEAAEKEATGKQYVVVPGKAITSLRGILGPGTVVKEKYLTGGKATFAALKKNKSIVKK